MSKIRIYELAKQLNITSKTLILHLKDLGIEVVNHMSTIGSEQANIVKDLLSNKNNEEIDSKNGEIMKNEKLEMINDDKNS